MPGATASQLQVALLPGTVAEGTSYAFVCVVSNSVGTVTSSVASVLVMVSTPVPGAPSNDAFARCTPCLARGRAKCGSR